MKQVLRRNAWVAAALLPLLGGCAGSGCEYLVYEERPEAAPPLVIPEGVPAPPETGEFRLPTVTAEAPEGCLATPPMTLPPEALEEPEDANEGEPAGE